MTIKDYLNEQRAIHIKQLDKVTFLGFASGLMRMSPKGYPITSKASIKSNKKMPIWDRLTKSGLLTKKELENDEFEFFLTKKGIKLAQQLVDDGDLYNPNNYIFKT